MNNLNENFIVKTVNISKYYPETLTKALNNVSINIKQGEFISIKGPSGCGKSSLLNIIGGLTNASDGSVYIDNVDITKIKNLPLYRRNNIGFIFQDYYLYPRLSVIENILLPLAHSFFINPQNKEKAINLLSFLNMEGKEKNSVNGLSSGERQRVCIARALLNDPKLILADEPTGSLDSKNAHNILEFLQKINKEKGTTILMVTHDEKTLGYNTRTINIVDGEVVGGE